MCSKHEERGGRVILAAVLEHCRRAVRVTHPSGEPVESDVADRFERAVLGAFPNTPQHGYILAFGRASNPCELDFLSYSPDDLGKLVSLARTSAALFDFRQFSNPFEKLCDRGNITASRVHIYLNERVVTVAGALAPITPREFELITALALPRRPVSAERLTDTLWPDADPWRAKAALKVLIHRLRRRIGATSITCRNGLWSLNAEMSVDIWTWEDALTRSRVASLDDPTRLELRRAHDALTARPDGPTRTSSDVSLIAAIDALAERIGTRLVQDALDRAARASPTQIRSLMSH